MLTYIDFFAGLGGSSFGSAAVPGIRPVLAANHWDRAITAHALNFPDCEHYMGDLHDADVSRFPAADIFWASPECPAWSVARGRRRDFDQQPDLFGEVLPDAAADRSRALMWDVPRYLEATAAAGRPVLAGVVENVIDVRAWHRWMSWRQAIRALGYDTRLIALNSMHAFGVRTVRVPQSRDRLYLAYWHRSLGRVPDWDKWLRPPAWCAGCGQVVTALQVFKDPKRDMGRYRQQYVYRCPNAACRSAVVEPETLPAAAAIDWSLPAVRIGDRRTPLAAATIERIRIGLDRYAAPLLAPAGGTWRTAAVPTDVPMPTRTTRANDGLAVPPLLVPVEGRTGKFAAPATAPLRTQTARNETGLAVAPYLISLRGGGDRQQARSVDAPLTTVTASGNHHGLALPDAADTALMIPYYGTGTARPVAAPLGTVTTRDRFGLAAPAAELALEEVRFRMLEPPEIGRAMAFPDSYATVGSKREKVRLYGNAVTPPVAEVIVSALVEAVTGTELDRTAGGGGRV